MNDPRGCDKWKSGLCAAIPAPTYCPQARAQNAGPGECCHHPLFVVRPRLAEMKAAGVKLARYGEKLRDPGFVDKLYSAFLKARAKRSTTARNTSGRS